MRCDVGVVGYGVVLVGVVVALWCGFLVDARCAVFVLAGVLVVAGVVRGCGWPVRLGLLEVRGVVWDVAFLWGSAVLLVGLVQGIPV